MNIDHCNSHSSFTDKVEMSNLCQEITLPTKPLQHIDDENGEIALCILSAINVGKIRDLEDLQVLCDLAVRSLDELIDFQNYPIRAAEIATKSTPLTWNRLHWSSTLILPSRGSITAIRVPGMQFMN